MPPRAKPVHVVTKLSDLQETIGTYEKMREAIVLAFLRWRPFGGSRNSRLQTVTLRQQSPVI